MSTPARDSFSAKFCLLTLPEPVPSQAWSAEDLANMDTLEGADLPECILKATILGRERTVRTIMERRGRVPIVLEGNPQDEFEFKLNAIPVELDYTEFAGNIRSPAALKSLFAMIAEFDMKGLVEPYTAYPLLLKSTDHNPFLLKYNVSAFSGVLPSLVDGVLGRPELAIALKSESSRTSTPDAYQPMLCWASEDMLTKFPDHLAALKPVQQIKGIGTLQQWKSASGQPGNMDFSSIELGLEATEACSDVVEYVQECMTPEESKFGFADEQGRRLCETTADFLLQFPALDCEEDNLKAAFSFAANYCPISIMSTQAVVACQSKFGFTQPRSKLMPDMKTTLERSFNFLFSALRDGQPLQKRVMDLMSKEQWVGLYHKAKSIDADSLVGLHQAFGLDNTGKSLDISIQDLEILASGGYRFVRKTEVFLGYNSSDRFDEWSEARNLFSAPCVVLPFHTPMFISFTGATAAQQVYRNILKVNLWPASGFAPKSIADALIKSSAISLEFLTNSTALSLHSYFSNAGVEACAESVTSPGHWEILTHVFSADELKPYLAEMPREARGLVLEAGLGL
jgi:hypothetical protein